MHRQRHQKGSLQVRQHGKRKMWVLLYRDGSTRKYATLGGTRLPCHVRTIWSWGGRIAVACNSPAPVLLPGDQEKKRAGLPCPLGVLTVQEADRLGQSPTDF